MQFSDIPWFIIQEYLNKISSYKTPSNYEAYHSNGGGFIVSNQNKLVTKNTDPMKLYAKSEDTDYRDVRANVISSWEEENKIIFRRLFSKTILPSEEIDRTITQDGYEQTTYKYLTEEDDYQYDIQPGDKIYSRKDSLFRKWITDNWDRFEDYLNIQTPFLYIGDGYKRDKYFEVNYWGINDWVKEAVPINQRNEKFDKFIDLIFDKLYTKLYNKQKNIFSLIDPFEIESDRIDDLERYYSSDLLSLEIEEFKRRIFIDNLITWLKQRGTYSSLFVIWNILSRNTGNSMKVYDRWHTPIPSGSPYPYFEDHDYTEYYNGNSYPEEYDLSNKVLSTHYKIEFDVNANPFTDGYILNKELADDLYNKWEDCRPVTRVSHYQMNMDTLIDFTGREHALYVDPLYDANVFGATTLFTEASSGAAIYVQTQASDTWTFDHMLDTSDVIVDVYNINLERIYAKEINIIHNNRVRVIFNEPVLGTILVLKADYTRNQGFNLDTWTVNHLLNHKYVIPQIHSNSQVVLAKEITAIDENTLEVETESLSGAAQISDVTYTHIQSTESDVWEINHNLGYVGVMIDLYDENDQAIRPANILLKNIHTAYVYFDHPIKGYAGVKSIGNPRVGGELIGRFDGTWKVVFGNAEDTEDWDYEFQNNVKSPLWTVYHNGSDFIDTEEGFRFELQAPKGLEGYVSEMGIFDNTDNLSFYLRGDYLYKKDEFILNINYNIQNENL